MIGSTNRPHASGTFVVRWWVNRGLALALALFAGGCPGDAPMDHSLRVYGDLYASPLGQRLAEALLVGLAEGVELGGVLDALVCLGE